MPEASGGANVCANGDAMHKMMLQLLLTACLALLPVCFVLDGFAQERPPDLIRGSFLYRTHCSRCHGHTGHGEGSLGQMLGCAPMDLTQLLKNEEYSVSQIMEMIDHKMVSCSGQSHFFERLRPRDKADIAAFLQAMH
ncbi:MAG: high-affinity iron transporter [Desulfovibrionales bacterium]|nr:high-affinity iron transporter [Desulfovibrionales bacterium]